ncbi:hypothetical protein HOG48_00080 [Candidatus Peregrinibacteria bacterium]|jgi:hypothetical protein|nr:hypothetical protein [Candidatus Peregrinibacteria bacterium]
MKKYILNLVVVLGIFLLGAVCSYLYSANDNVEEDLGANIKSVHKSVEGSYSFLAVGHIYGAPRFWAPLVDRSIRKNVFPASSIVSFVDDINKMGAEFMVFIGDSVMYGEEDNYFALKNTVLDELELPIFASIGNHDVLASDPENARSFHEKYLGEFYSSFKKDSEYFIFLDTGDSLLTSMSEDQLEFIRSEISEAKRNPEVKNVFIFTHKLVWVSESEELEKMIYWSTSDYKNIILKGNNISEVFPDILSLAQNKKVFWGSGDIKELYPAFYHYDKESNITYFANSLNDSRDDLMFKVNIDKHSEVEFELISLFDGSKKDPLQYGEDLWTSKRGY